MQIIDTQTTNVVTDQEGDHYFMVGETVYYLKDFVWVSGNVVESETQFDAVSHITNTGGIGVVVDEANEEITYTIFTT